MSLNLSLLLIFCFNSYFNFALADNRPKNVNWPETFTMHWTFYYIEESEDVEDAPYKYNLPQSLYRSSRGITYSNSNYRSGSQKEYYLDRCIPIWDGDLNFPCEFINVNEEKKGYVIAHNSPSDFPACCLIGDPFYRPADNFTDKMLYGGIQKYPNINKEYLSFYNNFPDIGGLFEYTFWNEPKKFNNKTYYTPAYFKFKGVNNQWVFQRFYDFSTSKPSDDVFDIPEICRGEIPFCPGFDPNKAK